MTEATVATASMTHKISKSSYSEKVAVMAKESVHTRNRNESDSDDGDEEEGESKVLADSSVAPATAGQ